MYQLLREEVFRKGNLRVCEIGVDQGQLKHFFNSAYQKDHGNANLPIQCWDAIDVNLQHTSLDVAGYQARYSLDLEHDDIPGQLNQQYDVVILLHVLEHLQEPELVMQKIMPMVKAGGVVIGGMPVLPECLVQWREKNLRSKAAVHGHVSVFSPARIARISSQNGVYLEFCRGAFLLRSKKNFLENYAAWLRFNLAFGAFFPSWPGEIYWSMRLPSTRPGLPLQ